MDTIELSDDVLLGAVVNTDHISDTSFTPSEFRSVSQFLNQDNSLSYSVIDAEYQPGKPQQPPKQNKSETTASCRLTWIQTKS